MEGLRAEERTIFQMVAGAGQKGIPYVTLKAQLAETMEQRVVTSSVRQLLTFQKIQCVSNKGEHILFVKQTLTDTDVLVLDAIRAAGNVGIDNQSIIGKTRLNKAEVLKGINHLLHHNYIKQARVFTSKTKRVFILADLEPAREVTGGTFYTESRELNYALIEHLRTKLIQFVKSREVVTVQQIVHYFNSPEVSQQTGSVMHAQAQRAKVTGGPASHIAAANNAAMAELMAQQAQPVTVSEKDCLSIIRVLELDGFLEKITSQLPVSSSSFDMGSRQHSSNVEGLFPGTGATGGGMESASIGSFELSSPENIVAAGGAGAKDAKRGTGTSPTTTTTTTGLGGTSGATGAAGGVMYRIPHVLPTQADKWYNGFPCVGCPFLFSGCNGQGYGNVQPIDCKYLKDWLQLS